MTDDDLKRDIVKLLRKRKRMAGGSIAWTLKTESKRVRPLLFELIEEGEVALCLDGVTYEIGHGGHTPGPEAA